MKSRVPQGSVFGRLIFLRLIGDIDQNISSAFLSSFADDTRVGKGIETEQDVSNLQDNLNSVYTWAKNNNMEFNSDKFELLRYRVPSALIQDQTFYKADNGDMIEEKYLIRDLGITIANDASFLHNSHPRKDRSSEIKSRMGPQNFENKNNANALEAIDTARPRLLLSAVEPREDTGDPGRWSDPQNLPAKNPWDVFRELLGTGTEVTTVLSILSTA